jgi:hypothetical protein
MVNNIVKVAGIEFKITPLTVGRDLGEGSLHEGPKRDRTDEG